MIIYRCRNCGYVLNIYDGKRMHPYGPPSPSAVISWYGGVCPRCGSRLKPPSFRDVRIQIAKRDRYPPVFDEPTCREKVVAVLVANRNLMWSASTLAYATGCSVKTCYKILMELLRLKIVKRDPSKKRLRVTLVSDISPVEIIHKLKA